MMLQRLLSLLVPLLLLVPLVQQVAASTSSSFSHYQSQPRIRLEANVHHNHIGRSRSYEKLGRATSHDFLTLQFALKHNASAVAALEKTLYQVSDPLNQARRYGQYLSIDDITELVAPPAQHSEVVRDMLLAYGMQAKNIQINKNRDIVTIEGLPATVAEKMLQTELYRFRARNNYGMGILIRAGAPYSLPASVAPYVSFVSELLRFPAARNLPFVPAMDMEEVIPFAGQVPEAAFQACGLQCAGFVTPQVLAARYNLPLSLESEVVGNNSIAVAEFQLEYFDRRDLYNFANVCDVDKVTVDTVIGGWNIPFVCTRGGGCIEALLDIEWINAAAPGVPLSVYYSTSYSLLEWIGSVNNNTDAELVHSVSYGNDELQQSSTDYMLSLNVEFMKAGCRGISLFVASGDQGVWGRLGPENNVFHPDFPASSPYVTSVGGTDFVTQSVVGEEQAWESSGGGFSDTFAMPEYQAQAVANYMMVAAETLPPSFMWNSTGRGYPDVSALGGGVNPYCVSAEAGSLAGVYGTSASCPVVAGLFAQLNNVRLSAGKPAMGFVNPFVYQNSDCFLDVTKGVNDGGYNWGFAAADGWDACTGVGTPDFAKLKGRVMEVVES